MTEEIADDRIKDIFSKSLLQAAVYTSSLVPFKVFNSQTKKITFIENCRQPSLKDEASKTFIVLLSSILYYFSGLLTAESSMDILHNLTPLIFTYLIHAKIKGVFLSLKIALVGSSDSE